MDPQSSLNDGQQSRAIGGCSRSENCIAYIHGALSTKPLSDWLAHTTVRHVLIHLAEHVSAGTLEQHQQQRVAV